MQISPLYMYTVSPRQYALPGYTPTPLFEAKVLSKDFDPGYTPTNNSSHVKVVGFELSCLALHGEAAIEVLTHL